MREVKIDTDIINAAAKEAGCTPEEYIARHKGFFLGRRVYAHKARVEDDGRTTVFFIK